MQYVREDRVGTMKRRGCFNETLNLKKTNDWMQRKRERRQKKNRCQRSQMR